MNTNSYLFWVLAFTGSVLAGWWLAVRPAASLRNLATPVAAMAVLLAVLLALMGFTGQDVHGFTSSVYDLTLGR
jgi:hypothetical protein